MPCFAKHIQYPTWHSPHAMILSVRSVALKRQPIKCDGSLPPRMSPPRWQQGKELWVEVSTLEEFDREVLAADRLVVVDW